MDKNPFDLWDSEEEKNKKKNNLNKDINLDDVLYGFEEVE
jgi:hypothetical protein